MKLKHVIVSTMLLFGVTDSWAATLEENMYALAAGLRTVQNTSSAEEMHVALTNMRDAATDAKRSIPRKLTGKSTESPEVRDYRAGIDQLIAQIDVVDDLARKNQLAEAKDAARELTTIARANHSKFN